MGMSSILRGFCTVLSTRNISPLCLLALLTVNLIHLTTPILVYGNVGSVLLFYLLEIFSPLCLLAQLIVVLIQLTIPILVYGNVLYLNRVLYCSIY